MKSRPKPHIDHTDADAPERGVENPVSTVAPSAVGVPDVVALIERLNSTTYADSFGAHTFWPLPNLHDEAADALTALQEQAQNFHMVYRMKCDVETKQQAATIKEMRELLDKAYQMLYLIGNSPEGIDRTIAEAEAFQAEIARLLERTK